MPTVSVIIPTYERANVLPRAVDSVLAQTLEDFELLVVDDGSTDATESVVRSYEDPRVTYLAHETNRGGSAARNTGIEAATGDYVAFLDSDDEWLPRKLERQVETLGRRSDEWVAAYCGTTVVSEESSPLWEAITSVLGRHGATEGAEGGEELVREVLGENLHASAGSTLLVERDVAEAIDGFDESFERYQDSEFLVRVLREGKLAFVDEPLLRRYPSGGPPPEAVRRANEHYLRTFSDTVATLESRGFDVTGAHQYGLARLYLRDGQFGPALRFLRVGSTPSLRQLPGLAYSGLLGLRSQFEAHTGSPR